VIVCIRQCPATCLPRSGGRCAARPLPGRGLLHGNVDVFLPVQIRKRLKNLQPSRLAAAARCDATVEADFSRRQNGSSLSAGIIFFVPRQRNAALSLAPVAAYVSQHYTRVGTLQNGMSVWKPNAVKPLLQLNAIRNHRLTR